MADRRSGSSAEDARSLAEKLLRFKQTLTPHERALFAALMLYVERDLAESDVAGYEIGDDAWREALAPILPTSFPDDPELGPAGATLGRN